MSNSSFCRDDDFVQINVISSKNEYLGNSNEEKDGSDCNVEDINLKNSSEGIYLSQKNGDQDNYQKKRSELTPPKPQLERENSRLPDESEVRSDSRLMKELSDSSYSF